VAQAIGKQAELYYEAGLAREGSKRCRELLDRFRSEDEPRIAEQVAWAEQMLRYDERNRSLRGRLKRRLGLDAVGSTALDAEAHRMFRHTPERSSGPRQT
jgi:hypothetical protein